MNSNDGTMLLFQDELDKTIQCEALQYWHIIFVAEEMKSHQVRQKNRIFCSFWRFPKLEESRIVSRVRKALMVEPMNEEFNNFS